MKPPAHPLHRKTWPCSIASSNGARRGFLLPFVLLLLSVLLLLAVTRHFFSRQQLHMVSHLSDAERAYQLACGGLEIGRSRLEAVLSFFNDGSPATFPKQDKAPPLLKPVFTGLFDERGLPLSKGGKVRVSSDLLGNLLGQVKEGRSLEVTIELTPAGPLFADSPKNGIQTDPREMAFHLFIHAVAQVGDATSRVSSWREARLINILPPVVGKFALFLRRQGSLDLNRAVDSLAGGLSDSPLVVHPGTAIPLRSLSRSDLARELDQRGWIFLGGPQPWRLNLSCGGGRPDLADGLLNPSLIEYPLPTTESLSSRGDLTAFMDQRGLARDWRLESENQPLLLKSPEESECSSLIHLAGSAAAPGPILVLGNARRRWVLRRGFFVPDQNKTIPLPWLDEATFSSDRWPGKDATPTAIRLIRDNFGGSYQAYAGRMSDLVEEDANAGNLLAMRFSSPEAGSALLLNPDALPDGEPPKPLTRIQVGGRPVDGVRMAAGGAFSIQDSAGSPLFVDGDLSEFSDLAFIKGRASRRYPDAKQFLREIPRTTAGELILDGAVLITGGLSLSQPLAIAPGGGMLLVEGPVELKSRITTPDSDPLTIVSFGGDITVATGEPVQAGLVTLNGGIRIPGPCRLQGFIAAREIGFGPPQPSLDRRLEYRSLYDPTEVANRDRMYRFTVQERERIYVH